MMKEVNVNGYKFLQINKEPKIFVSIKGKNNFCSLDSSGKANFLKDNFQVSSYRDFNQTHGVDIYNYNYQELEADGFITSKRNTAYGIKTADCLPIIFWNDSNELSGLHCGWRGVAYGIIDRLLMSQHGAKMQYAFFGPSISKNFFEVKEDLIEVYLENSLDIMPFIETIDHKKYFDLRAFCREHISNYGLKILELKKHCSYRNKDLFFSWRRDKEKSLRNICLAWV
ncbi:MAG: laccase domain-containing protein [SAR86 cluster bacterium]|uniref:Laccase domain-containing protein n=1 Tax=SAR86 cluster bacterium TaxID=2030880 RepID=A0A368BPY3_9GAMM|nr:MAG: laccase domain-containing protein [SAR86 cluster bacterium]|tara:strand:- start:195 stop:875 length:681 start_codon:yes stop_codon:yes gene_type:complete